MKENLNLKIYGTTKVWAKWQIIIPKDCREDLNIKTGDEFILAMVDNQAFGIWRPLMKRNKETHRHRCLEKIWEIQVWTKYQFVIPSILRKKLWIESENTLLIIWKQRAKWEEWVWFIKNDNIEYLLDFIKDYVNN